jgi:hypothetical protein
MATHSFLSSMIPAATILSLSLAGTAAFAQTTTTPAPPSAPKGTGANFQEHQQKELARIGQHIQILQTLQSCVQSATDHAAIKTCNETAKQSEQAMRH